MQSIPHMYSIRCTAKIEKPINIRMLLKNCSGKKASGKFRILKIASTIKNIPTINENQSIVEFAKDVSNIRQITEKAVVITAAMVIIGSIFFIGKSVS